MRRTNKIPFNADENFGWRSRPRGRNHVVLKSALRKIGMLLGRKQIEEVWGQLMRDLRYPLTSPQDIAV
jgi:hypothetical protein